MLSGLGDALISSISFRNLSNSAVLVVSFGAIQSEVEMNKMGTSLLLRSFEQRPEVIRE